MKKKVLAGILILAMMTTMTACGDAEYVVRTPDGATHEVSEAEAKEIEELQNELKAALGISDDNENQKNEDQGNSEDKGEKVEEKVDNTVSEKNTEDKTTEVAENAEEKTEEKYVKFEELMGKSVEYGIEGFGILFDIYENGAAIRYIYDEFAVIPETVKASDGTEYPVIALGTGNKVFDLYRSDKMGPYEVPQNIKYIADNAFYNAQHITELIIPDTVEFIGGSRTFESMYNLEKISFPERIKTNGTWDCTFEECRVLTNVDIPAGVYELRMTFDNCGLLESYSLPEGLLEVGEFTFNGCEKLTEIKLPDSVEVIGNGVFAHTAITRFEYPQNLKKLDFRTFEWCSSLEELRIPNIEDVYGDIDYIFVGESLESIVFEEGLTCQDMGSRTTLGVSYYDSPNLKSIVCPNGVTDIRSDIEYFPEGQLTIYIDEEAVAYFQAKFPNVTFIAK